MTASEKLPLQLTSFIGRKRDLNKVAELIVDPVCRLLSLVGPGGVGKTRLAHEVVRHVHEKFADGAVWINLQSVEGEGMLAPAIAGALGLTLTGVGDVQRQLFTYLRDKNLLLALDNLEQLALDTLLLSDMLREAETVTILATSRRALHIEGEWLYPLSGMPYPTGVDGQPVSATEIESADAVRLFVERARQVQPAFSLSAEQEGVLRICHLVGGVPLALEIAATWTRHLDCHSIADEIEDSVEFLTSPLRNAPRRHRSMQAVFGHSWSLLSAEEQAAFRRMAVFRGGMSREAGEKVAGAALPILTSLVDKSLLWREPDGRYRMHNLLRQYAETHLRKAAGEAKLAKERHARFYLAFLSRCSQAMFGGAQQSAVKHVEAEIENIYIAWQTALEQGMTAVLVSAVEPLAMYFHLRSRYLEGLRTFEKALQYLQSDDETTLQARTLLLCEGGWLGIRLGQFDHAQSLFEASQTIYQHLNLGPLPGEGTDPLLGLSTLASIRGDYALAERQAEQARRVAVAQGHLHNLQTADFQLSSVAYARGLYGRARQFAAAAYATCQQSGDSWFEAYCLVALGKAELALENYDPARQHFGNAFELREAFADRQGMALSLSWLGEVALREGKAAESQTLLERSLALYRKIGDRGGLAAVYQGLGRALTAQKCMGAARQHYSDALRIAAEIQFAPLLLAILADVGQFLLEHHAGEMGLALCAFAHDQPATEQRTKELIVKNVPALGAIGEGHPEQHFSDVKGAVSAALEELDRKPRSVAAEGARPAPTWPTGEPLTERELEVLRLIARGLTNRQIAEELTVVVGTVKAHNNRIFGKLGVTNRVQAVAKAREFDLLGGG